MVGVSIKDITDEEIALEVGRISETLTSAHRLLVDTSDRAVTNQYLLDDLKIDSQLAKNNIRALTDRANQIDINLGELERENRLLKDVLKNVIAINVSILRKTTDDGKTKEADISSLEAVLEELTRAME